MTKKQKQIAALKEASRAFHEAGLAAQTLAQLMGPEELEEAPHPFAGWTSPSGSVKVTRVDPQTDGPVPTVLAHFPIAGAQWGWMCTCHSGGTTYSTKREWAEHLVANLWPVMDEEPF